jgi:hypothetical protein
VACKKGETYQNPQIKKLADVGSGHLREVLLEDVMWWFSLTVCCTNGVIV